MSITFYERNAEAYFRETVGADVEPLRLQFLHHLSPTAHILDAGCGSGRNAVAFLRAGFHVTAIDASPEMVRLAADHTGLDVKLMTFDDISWTERFDGIWACASLLHVARLRLPHTLRQLRNALRVNGAFYMSFKEGTTDRVVDDRTFVDMSGPMLLPLLHEASLVPVDMWTTPDVRLGRRDERWLNVISLRK